MTVNLSAERNSQELINIRMFAFIDETERLQTRTIFQYVLLYRCGEVSLVS